MPLPSHTLPPFEHTNSYLVQNGPDAALIDAGSADPGVLSGLETTLQKLGVKRLQALLLTHTHPDHSTGAGALRERYGLRVYVHPLEPAVLTPTEPLADGASFRVGDRVLTAQHTPGHSPGHLSFTLPDAQVVFVGDLLAAQGSTWVGLPGGDVTDYLASLTRLEALVKDLAAGPGSSKPVFGPGHGPLICDPAARLSAARAHRLAREAEVMAALENPLTLLELGNRIYPDQPDALRFVTEGSLRAHLVKLVREGRVQKAAKPDDERYWQARQGLAK